MNKFRVYLLTALGITILGAAVTFTSTGQALAQGAMKALLVKDVENPARLAAQGSTYADAGEGVSQYTIGFPNLDSPQFPAGKRLAIEHLTVMVRVPEGQKVWANIVTPLKGSANGGNGDISFNSLVMTDQGPFGGQEVFAASLPVRFYVDQIASAPWGEFQTHLNINRNSDAGAWSMEASYSGHFVDLR
jgi:hypothetical protein